MSDKTCNGWPNHETWMVFCWIENDDYSQALWLDEAACLHADASPYGLAQAMKELYTENVDLFAESMPGMYVDLLTSALQAVSWRSIALYYIAAANTNPTAPDPAADPVEPVWHTRIP